MIVHNTEEIITIDPHFSVLMEIIIMTKMVIKTALCHDLYLSQQMRDWLFTLDKLCCQSSFHFFRVSQSKDFMKG